MWYQLAIQFLAIIALVVWASSYHFKERKTILLVQLASFVFWIIHFILISAYTGAALAGVAALRLAFFSFKKKNNWTSKPIVAWAFLGLLLISTALTYSTYWALFALIGGIFALVASWQDNQNRIRLLFIPSHLSWIVYDIFAGSYGGAISEALLGVSALVSFFRAKIKKV
ncbi:MAG: YgjV family protein [Candidatus Paceibacterota bacterium]|jgi:hypothetical protein